MLFEFGINITFHLLIPHEWQVQGRCLLHNNAWSAFLFVSPLLIRHLHSSSSSSIVSQMQEPYKALCDTDPSWQLEITVNSSSAWFPLTNSQCCNVKWSAPQTRERHRCSLTRRRLHLNAPIHTTVNPTSRRPSSLQFVMFHHINFHLIAPATFFTVISLPHVMFFLMFPGKRH